MSDILVLPQVDKEIASRIDAYSDDFWASTNRDPREDIHAYFQYPAMMVPGIQRELIEVVCELQPMTRNVLDPFVGAGTTMTDCMYLALNFTGQDINPLAVLVSRTKMGPFFHKALPAKVERVLERVGTDESEQIEARFSTLDKWFQPEVQFELSKIRRAIRSENQLWARRFMWVALAETVRLTSNSRTSTYKLHTRPKDEIESREISAIETFGDIVSRNRDDFLGFRDALNEAGCLHRDRHIGKLSIHLQDSTVRILPPSDYANQYDLLITSPPYGDNTSTVPYGQHSYLPLQWIDLEDIDEKASNGDWLRTTQEIDRRSLGGKRPRKLDPFVKHLAERSSSYKATVNSLTEQPRDRRSRVTAFSYDLDKTLDPIVSSLRRNAYLIWIVGNRHVGGIEIPTDEILIELLERRQVIRVTQATRRIVFRRMAARNQISSMMRQEHILVFRKVGE
ncbi:MAG: site-specific DNA-methyltransferase [Anaerolineae bacterium]|nr:site-specific DNA-methyltransferase [Anaerolineae bacterium]